MPYTRLASVFMMTISMVSCVQTTRIEEAINSGNEKIARVAGNLTQHEVQIAFSEIIRNPDDSVTLINEEFQVNDYQYFYPASTVKFPVALLALEKLSENPALDRTTPFMVAGDLEPTTFEREITDLFVISDNDAYNRLFEYLGKDEINKRLADKNIKGRISHRLSVPDSDNLSYKSLQFFLPQNTMEFRAASSLPIITPAVDGLKKGKAFLQDGELIRQPFDFSEKNYLPLRSLHDIMKRLILPELFEPEQQFNLTESDRRFVLDTMKTLPEAAGFVGDEYYDSYVKFFLFGDSKAAMPSHIEIYNKVGYAYGTLTDCAYILDRKQQKEYIITATILVNENQTFNDDDYEYESIGIPFLAELGRQLVAVEL